MKASLVQYMVRSARVILVLLHIHVLLLQYMAILIFRYFGIHMDIYFNTYLGSPLAS